MDFSKLLGLASGHVEARIIQTAIELQVFDTLAPKPSLAGDVAKELQLDQSATELLLNALVALELLEKDAAQFRLAAAAARYLLKSSPEYLGGMIHFESMLWQSWEQLPNAVRSGKPPRAAHMYQNDPREMAIFIEAMDSLVKARGDVEATAQAFAWKKKRNLLDVGAGPATYPIGLCRRFSELTATVFDLPGTLELTRRYIADNRMATRIQCIAGDYRTDTIPGSYDVIFLSNIIHGEGTDENRKLMAKLFTILEPGGHLIIKDHILDDNRTTPPVGAIFSLLMLLTTQSGRCYSFGEIKNWLGAAGMTRIHKFDFPAPFTSSLVIGEKALA